MKTRDFDTMPRRQMNVRQRRRKASEGPSFGFAVLGAVCVVGVFALLALLYHLQ